MIEYLPKQGHLLTLLPAGFILIFSDVEHKLVWLIVSVLVAGTLSRIIAAYSRRVKRHKVFDQGNVPSVDNKNPISGNVFEVLTSDNNIQVIKKYHDTLGKTFGIFYGPYPWYLTMEEEVLHKVYIEESDKHIDINDLKIPAVTEISRSLIQLRGEEWRRTRRALNPSFSHRQMKTDNVFKDIEEACVKFEKSIEAAPIRSGARTMDVLHNFKKFTGEIFSKVAFGQENAINMTLDEKDKLIESFDGAFKSLSSPIVLISVFFASAKNILGYLAKYSEFSYHMKHIISVLDTSLNQRRAKGRKSPIDDSMVPSVGSEMRKMIDTMIEAVDSKQMDNDTLRANLFFIFAAGFETTSITLSMMFWLLAKHPECQEKLRDSIKREGEESTYLTWVMQETLRLYPPILGVGRTLADDVHLSNNRTLYMGSSLIACVYSIHHSEEYWGSDVEQFRPERYDGIPLSPTRWFAFGKGLRVCLGRNLVKVEIKAIVTRLLLKYRIEPSATTPTKIQWKAPNMAHMIVEGPINLNLVELD